MAILEPLNIICPKCGNANYMRHLSGKNIGKLDVKCINCNSYYNLNDLNERYQTNVISESDKEKLIKRLLEYPVPVIAMAFVYATSLSKFGVDVSKEWTTATEQKEALDLAYTQGRHDEREIWTAHKEKI